MRTVVRRHLGADPLPADAWAAATAGYTPEDQRTPAQREALALAATLVAELQAADAVVLAVPLYNFGVSQHFKTWIDLVIAGAGASTPLLEGKPVVLVTIAAAPTAPAPRARAGTTHPATCAHPRRRLGADLPLSSAIHPGRRQPGPRPVQGPRRRSSDHAGTRRARHAGKTLAAE